MAEKPVGYWKRIHQRAFKDARHALSIETGERAVIGIALVVIALAAIWLTGAREIVFADLAIRSALSAAVVLAFPFVYLWKLVAAPAKLDAELRAELDSAKGDFSSEVRSNVYARVASLPPEIKRELYRVVTAEIEVHHLNNEVRGVLEKAGLIQPAYAYDPPELLPRYRSLVEQWFKANPLRGSP